MTFQFILDFKKKARRKNNMTFRNPNKFSSMSVRIENKYGEFIILQVLEKLE